MGPETAEDHALWPHLGPGRISAEELISGRGVLRLYKAVCVRDGSRLSLGTPAAVKDAAVARTDPAAVEAVRILLRFLGRFAGDMALAMGATGGVFIGGGMTPRLQALLPESGFREAFEAKAPQDALMRETATTLVTSDAAALIGLAALASAPRRFMLDYERRFWRQT
jgi:glucokinase